MKEKLRILNRAVTPHLDFRCSRWPWSTNMCRVVDATQKRMVAILADVPRLATDTADGYVSKRGRVAAMHCRALGWWSERHRRRVQTWHAHLLRDRNAASPAAMLFRHRDAGWLRERRLAVGSQAATAGRLVLRRCTHVNMRWEDGAVRAGPMAS